MSILHGCRESLKLLLGMNSHLGDRETPEYMRRDQFLTDKHLRAIFNFLETDNEFLLIVSDDVILDNSDASHFVRDVFTILEKSIQNPTYIELCEFYDVRDLVKQFKLKTYEIEAGLDHWNRIDFFCNTGASYIINHLFAKHIATVVTHNPWLRVCRIDWLLTFISRKESQNGKILCFLSTESLFKNFSLESGISDLVGKNLKKKD